MKGLQFTVYCFFFAPSDSPKEQDSHFTFTLFYTLYICSLKTLDTVSEYGMTSKPLFPSSDFRLLSSVVTPNIPQSVHP